MQQRALQCILRTGVSFRVQELLPLCLCWCAHTNHSLLHFNSIRYFVLKRHVARGEATFADPSPAERRELAAVIRLWESAAKEGSALAMHNLGCLYEKGRGVPQSDCEAAHWHERAATVGLAAAQFALGFLCEHGRADGGTADGRDGCSGAASSSRENAAKHAAKWYLAAALQGDAKAQCNLGVLYEQVLVTIYHVQIKLSTSYHILDTTQNTCTIQRSL